MLRTRTAAEQRQIERGLAEAEAAQARDNAFTRLYGGPYRRRLPLPADARKAPPCACCGKGIGTRLLEEQRQMLTAADGKPQPYRGNGLLVEEELYSYGDRNGQPAAMLVRRVWDGETFAAKFRPFCSSTCALIFARAAYKAGWRPA